MNIENNTEARKPRCDVVADIESAVLGKDAVYAAWPSTTATAPPAFTIVYRELLAVDIVDRVIPYAANDDAPIVFVSTRADEFFAVDRRGSLARILGKPKNIGKGRQLAMKRIHATGAASIEPEAAVGTLVRFG